MDKKAHSENFEDRAESSRDLLEKQEEFEDLLALHQQRILGFIFSILRDVADSQDVLQQTAVVLWQKFDRFERDTNFLSWAMAVARLEALSFIRYRRRRRMYFDQGLMEQIADDVVDRSRDYELCRREALQGCVSKLPQKDKSLLTSRYSHGLGAQQMAEILDRSANSITNSLTRIRRRLLECIERSVRKEFLR